MTFNDFINKAWLEHGQKTLKVAEDLHEAEDLAQSPSDLASLATLATHVLGQHLGRFAEAITYLQNLKTHPKFVAEDSEAAIDRFIAALQLACNQNLSLDKKNASDQTRIYATAAALLSERDAALAREFLITSMSIAAAELDKVDPAIQALAATTHNLAAGLEVKKTLRPDEQRLMLEAALASRKYWEMVGTWKEWQQSEYRLAMSHSKAGQHDLARQNARDGLRICQENKGGALDYFFAYECIALVARVANDTPAFEDAAGKAREHYMQLNVEDKKYCEESLRALG